MSETRRTNAEIDRDLRQLRAAFVAFLNDLAQRGHIGPQVQARLDKLLNGPGEEDQDATRTV